MCVNYVPVPATTLNKVFDTRIDPDLSWPEELYQDYLGPIIVPGKDGSRQGLVANFSMVPKRHLPQGTSFTTMNARDDRIGHLKTYRQYWANCQLCLVPMQVMYEPNWEESKHVRWQIGMADDAPFAVAGLYRQWAEADGSTSFAFTQITINADDHPLMNRFHKAGEEKRSLAIIPPAEYDDWLACKDPEIARSFLRGFPPQLMAAKPAPKLRASKQPSSSSHPVTMSLF